MEIELRCTKAQAAPWKAYIEGANHESGSSFIKTAESDEREQDIEIIGATNDDYLFIAHARQDIPRLIEEVRMLIYR